MIWYAKFTGRKVGAIGIFYPIQTYCYGADIEAATLDLYQRYEHIAGLKLEVRPVVKVGDCKPGDRIQLVQNGTIVENGLYIVQPVSEIVAPVACMFVATGITQTVDAELDCVVSP